MTFGWPRPLGRSQPKDILDEAINQHKAICPILMTIIARQNLQSLLILFNKLKFFMGSMYGAYIVNYKQELIEENLH